jgi:hypothetical protein
MTVKSVHHIAFAVDDIDDGLRLFPLLQTGGLVLREFSLEDIPAVFALLRSECGPT